LAVAKEFEQLGITRLHVVDLDGAKLSMPQNLNILEQIASQTSLKIEYGGGIKSREAIENVFSSGGTWAICGSTAVSNPELFIEWLKEFGADRVVLGADVKSGMVATHGWLKTSGIQLNTLVDKFIGHGLKEIITTDISCDGMLSGPSYDLYSSLQTTYPNLDIIVSGGISGMADIERLNSMGLKKVIVGKAIYEGKITYNQIKEWLLKE
ncbi:MAG: 1-(5-phosphoribosyl)-5-[(5-phosphoribosylamino)methylideneamino] imidazole-4-carboxamide isomerase, partial [Rikenellaceae bacterium]